MIHETIGSLVQVDTPGKTVIERILILFVVTYLICIFTITY